MAWNGTAAGWLGFENNRKLCRAIEQETGVPATTTVLALYQGSVIKTHRDGFAWFSARRARRSDAGHRKGYGDSALFTSADLALDFEASRAVVNGGVN